MAECKNCRNLIDEGNLLECPSCGATVCSACAEKSFRICPYCYSDLEFRG